MLEATPDWAVAIWQHRKVHGEFPNIFRPRTFNQKVLHRIIFDRREWLAETTDKYRVRNYVRERLGPEILPKLLHVTQDPSTIPFDDLPDRFVIKPTHGSGWVRIVHDKAGLDRAQAIEECRWWLDRNYYLEHREWAYKNIIRRILVQELVDDGSGPVPRDYRLYVFGGRVELVIVDWQQSGETRSRFFNLPWEQLNVSNGYPEIIGDLRPPKHFDEMIAAAETLARDIDFVKVDFFDTDAKLYFGELTSTPNCGLTPTKPAEFDRHLGSLWKL